LRTVFVGLLIAVATVVTVHPVPAATGVFSLDRLRIGSVNGPENTVFTAGNAIVPDGGVDAGAYYRFVVTDPSGATRNGPFPCTPAAQFETANNGYTVSTQDATSTATPWRYTLNEYSASTCTGTATKTASKTFYVARARAFGESSLATGRTAFAAGATAYVTITGLKPSTTNWSVTWIMPSGVTACANSSGNDRPASNATGALPKGSGSYVQYRPTLASGGSTWNRESSYELRPCQALALSSEGMWRLRLEKDATTFVMLDAFVVDATPPDTTITAAPSDPSSSATATFAFAASESDSRFQCDLDGGGYVDCLGSKTYTALSDGTHVFRVRAIDGAGNVDQTPATHTWAVDAAIPAVAILIPAAGSSTNDPTPVFSGTAGTAPGDSSTVTVAVSTGSPPSPVPIQTLVATRSGGTWSVESGTPFADGTYIAEATQTDSGGNVGRSSQTTFVVDTVPPETMITASPSDPSSSSSAIFGFASSDAGSTFRCSLDGAPFVACTSPNSYPLLANGTHSFSVMATDAAGNADSSPATYSWTVIAAADTTPPVVTLVTPADGSSTSSATPTFAGQGGTLAGDSSTVIVNVYAGTTATGPPFQVLTATPASNGAYAVIASSPLALGTYTARAEQADAAGNLGTSSANTFTIVSSPASYRTAVLTDNPSAYWRFGESTGAIAYDEVGQNNGTYSGGVRIAQGGALGDGNPAAEFDGVDDLVSVPHSPSLDAVTGVTMEAWVKRSKTGAWQNILAKPGDGASANQSYALWLNTTNQVVAIFGNGSSSLNLYAPSIDTNWHHLAATYDNATAKIYIDGVLRASANSSIRLTPNTRQLVIGRSLDNLRIFGGRIDEVAIYATALSSARIEAHFNRASTPPVGGDTTPPTIVLAAPADASSTTDPTPTLSGTAGSAPGDSTTVSVRIYSGSSVAGGAIQTLVTTRDASGAFAVDAAALTEGTYTAQAQQDDDAGNSGRSSSATFTVLILGGDPVLIGAGDIAYCGSSGDEATAALLDQYPSAGVFTLGDNAYENGTPSEFSDCYQPSWGRAKARTRPALGDHDYGVDADASGYMTYFHDQLAGFGAAAIDSSRGWYSYDVGTWHVVVLNTECELGRNPCTVTGQTSWLASDLAAHPTSCTLAILAAPRFSSGSVHGSSTAVQPYWQVLYDNNVELVLSGDDHVYERFGPQTPSGVSDPQRGIRQFVVGTGGRSHYSFANQIVANSEARDATTFGILKLVLHPTRYDWEFVPEAGRTFRDAGTQACH
jgi:hypothetical protein